MARLRIANGADVNHVSPCGTIVEDLAERRDFEHVKEMVALGAHPNPVASEHGWTLMHTAAKKQDTELYHLLGSLGADPDKPMSDGVTPRQMLELFKE
jgi:hypothetical protein